MIDSEFRNSVSEQINIYREFPLPVVICAPDWQVKWSNGLAERYYPHIAGERSLGMLLSEFDTAALVDEAVKTGNCIVRDIFPLSGVNMSVTPILAQGRLIGLTLIFMRTDNLIEAKDYFQSYKTAEALSESVREVVADVFAALDLVGAKADLMNAGWIKAGFNRVTYSGYRILRIASNITEFTKNQSGVGDLSFETVDLCALMSEIAQAVRTLALGMNTPVEFKLPDDAVLVNLDAAKFESAFFNVLHNSLYYTRPGNRILISLSKRRAKAVLKVADCGLGISAAVLPDVTKPYFTYSREGFSRCVGLGLTVAKMIVEAHDGELIVNSKLGKGTVVTVKLPEETFPRGAALEQGEPNYRLGDRFSSAYIGLTDAAVSPYRDE